MEFRNRDLVHSDQPPDGSPGASPAGICCVWQ